jgi:hypothetical protein
MKFAVASKFRNRKSLKIFEKLKKRRKYFNIQSAGRYSQLGAHLPDTSTKNSLIDSELS